MPITDAGPAGATWTSGRHLMRFGWWLPQHQLFVLIDAELVEATGNDPAATKTWRAKIAAVKHTLTQQISIRPDGTVEITGYFHGRVFNKPLRGRWSDVDNKYVDLDFGTPILQSALTYESGRLAFYHHPGEVVDPKKAIRFVLQKN